MPTKHIVLQRATLDEGTKGKRQADIIVKEEETLTPYAEDLRSKALLSLGGEF